MEKEQAIKILGDRAKWELKNMIKALLIMPILNTEEENERLIACKTLMNK